MFKKGLTPWNKNKKGVMPEPWDTMISNVKSQRRENSVLGYIS